MDSSEEEDEDEQQHEEAVIPQRMAVPSVFPLPSDQATAQALAAAAIHKAHSAGAAVQAHKFLLLQTPDVLWRRIPICAARCAACYVC